MLRGICSLVISRGCYFRGRRIAVAKVLLAGPPQALPAFGPHVGAGEVHWRDPMVATCHQEPAFVARTLSLVDGCPGLPRREAVRAAERLGGHNGWVQRGGALGRRAWPARAAHTSRGASLALP